MSTERTNPLNFPQLYEERALENRSFLIKSALVAIFLGAIVFASFQSDIFQAKNALSMGLISGSVFVLGSFYIGFQHANKGFFNSKELALTLLIFSLFIAGFCWFNFSHNPSDLAWANLSALGLGLSAIFVAEMVGRWKFGLGAKEKEATPLTVFNPPVIKPRNTLPPSSKLSFQPALAAIPEDEEEAADLLIYTLPSPSIPSLQSPLADIPEEEVHESPISQSNEVDPEPLGPQQRCDYDIYLQGGIEILVSENQRISRSFYRSDKCGTVFIFKVTDSQKKAIADHIAAERCYFEYQDGNHRYWLYSTNPDTVPAGYLSALSFDSMFKITREQKKEIEDHIAAGRCYFEYQNGKKLYAVYFTDPREVLPGYRKAFSIEISQDYQNFEYRGKTIMVPKEEEAPDFLSHRAQSSSISNVSWKKIPSKRKKLSPEQCFFYHPANKQWFYSKDQDKVPPGCQAFTLREVLNPRGGTLAL